MENYAGKENIDSAVAKELEIAGIEVHNMGFTQDAEVKTCIMGLLHNWSFRRAWYYWMAEGPGIPPKYANELHEKHGKAVRVDGDCSCPSPEERFKGLSVGHYHIDTQEGLNALANTIKQVIKDAQQANAGDNQPAAVSGEAKP